MLKKAASLRTLQLGSVAIVRLEPVEILQCETG